MEKILTPFETAINNTANAYPSIYSKDDVIQLLINLKDSTLNNVSLLLEENATVSVVNENEFQAFSDEVTNALDHFINRNEIIDTDSVEFGIDYDNRITIDNIRLQDDMLCDELRDILLDKFQEAFGKIKTQE
jgi:RNA binding exosome subunit